MLPSTDIYDNFDHDIVNNAQAVGSAAGVKALCSTPVSELPTEPSPIPAVWPYYTYPTPASTEGADGIPIDIARASASQADLANHGVTICSDLQQQGFAQDAVVGLSFSPQPTDGTVVEDVAPSATSIDFSNTGGPETATDTAWRVFCAPATDPLSITTWDQLAAVEGFTAPSPDQPLVLFGPSNSSGTGATFYTFGGCGTTDGRIPANHVITENNAQQLSQYAAKDAAETIPLNTAPVSGVPAAGSSTATIDNCGGDGTASTGLGTSSYTASNEKCVAQEVADSLFFMSYGYYASHTFTAAVTIPTSSVGDQPNYINNATNYQVSGVASTIGGTAVSGPVLGQPGTGGVVGDPRATNSAAVQTGRDLWMDYLTDHVRASAAAFVNWLCDSGNHVAPKGLDVTTGGQLDKEITNNITAWGWGRINCDGETGGNATTFTSPITTAVIDPGPPNNE